MVRVRPLDVDDADAVEVLDATHAQRLGRDRVATRGAISFYVRTGHAFVAEDGSGLRGFALAQAIWDGTRPTVHLHTLATEADDAEARAALLEAVTKSAYDAAVYDLVARAPDAEPDLTTLLQQEGWTLEPVALLRRTLGSRGGA